MLELIAERGCGYVLMHIEGPPRVDRRPPHYDDVVAPPRRVVRGRIDRALAAGIERGADRPRPRPRLRPRHRRRPRDPAPARRAALARPPAVRRAVAQGLPRRHRRRLLGGAARAERARARRRWPPRPSPSPQGAEVLRLHDTDALDAMRTAAAIARPGVARDRRCSPRLRRLPGSGCSRPASATTDWSRPASRSPGRRGRSTGPAASRRRWRRRSPGPGSRSSTRTRSRRSRPPRHGDVIVTSGTASGKSLSFNLPVLDVDRARPEDARPLPLPDQGARPGPGAKAVRARPRRASPRDL